MMVPSRVPLVRPLYRDRDRCNNVTASNTFSLTLSTTPGTTQAIASKTLTTGQTSVNFTPVTAGGGWYP